MTHLIILNKTQSFIQGKILALIYHLQVYDKYRLLLLVPNCLVILARVKYIQQCSNRTRNLLF